MPEGHGLKTRLPQFRACWLFFLLLFFVTRADAKVLVRLGTMAPEGSTWHDVLLQIAAQSAVPVIGLNWKDDNASARRWLAELGNPYAAVAEDREGRVAIDWGVYGAPETFLIGPDGTVLHKHVAPMTLEIWRTEFLPLIESARRTAASGG